MLQPPSPSQREERPALVEHSDWYFVYSGAERALSDVVPQQLRRGGQQALLQGWCVAWHQENGEAAVWLGDIVRQQKRSKWVMDVFWEVCWVCVGSR